MQIHLATLRFNPVTEGFDESELVSFLADKEILSIHDHFFVKDNIPYITLVVCYQAAALPAPADAAKPGKQRDESWKDLLTENDWPLFNTLRTWRAERSKQEGIAPYIICNNRELAEVVKARSQNLAALSKIRGFGEAKLKKYGKQILAFIAKDTPQNQEPDHGQDA